MVDVEVTVWKAVDTTVTGASVVGVTVVIDGVGMERQEHGVERALDAKVVNAPGMV